MKAIEAVPNQSPDRDWLYECPLFAEGAALAKWQAEFRQRFAELPDETILQIVDAHC
jgi:hypothetical protein